MNIEEIQKKIDEMQYWDSKVLDINSRYFGDEIEILIESEEENFCWSIIFESCYCVNYITDADWRKKFYLVKNMKDGQLGYFGQDITVEKSKLEDFVDVHIDLTLIKLDITCRKISVKKQIISRKDIFWMK